MTEQTTFCAQLSNVHPVKSRKVIQIIFEIDEAHAEEISAKLGYGSGNRWFGCAEITDEAAQDSLCKLKNESEEKPKVKTPFNEMQPSQQAGIACNDDEFSNWIHERYFTEWQRAFHNSAGSNKIRAKLCLYDILQISSRRELDADKTKAMNWRLLYGEFIKWRRAKNEPPMNEDI